MPTLFFSERLLGNLRRIGVARQLQEKKLFFLKKIYFTITK